MYYLEVVLQKNNHSTPAVSLPLLLLLTPPTTSPNALKIPRLHHLAGGHDRCLCPPSYLFLKVFENHLEGRVHATVSDLDDSLSIDANGDGKVTEDELKAKLTEATNYISNHVGTAAEGQPQSTAVTTLFTTRS